MRLRSLKVAGFRGFNEERIIDLEDALVIYCGSNGSGKSSIAEALEWVFFGFTLRREKGDEISKREYANSYRNVHYKGPQSPFVDLLLIDSSANERTLRRELHPDETSALSLDGNVVTDLKALGVTNLRDRPIILQHSLHDFIFMKPKERYEVLSRMLGLDDLITFRNTVDSVRNNIQKAYPKEVKETIYNAKLVLSRLETNPVTKVLVTLLNAGNAEAAYEQLGAIASGRITGTAQPEGLVDALKAEYALKQRMHLDWGKFSYQRSRVDNSHPIVKEVESITKSITTLGESLARLTVQVAGEKAKEDGSEYKEFLRIGLKLVESPELCPFCMEKSLTPERLVKIKEACAQSPVAQKQLAEVVRAIDSVESEISLGWKRITALVPKVPTEEEKTKISSLANKKPSEDLDFLIQAQQVSTGLDEISMAKEALSVDVQEMKRVLSSGQEAKGVGLDIGVKLKSYTDALQSLAATLNDYADGYVAIDPVVKRGLASSADITMLDVLIEAMEKWTAVQYLKYLDGIDGKLLELVKITRQHIEEKQKHILGLRDRQIKDWYDLMNPGAGVSYDSIAPSTDTLELRGRTFGQMMMAAPNLSTAQLNCVGLAVTLACTTRPDSIYKFIVIDDPIQSMDDEHSESFKMSVVKKLLDMGFQVILLTQLDRFADGVESLYRQTVDKVCLYQIKGYQVNGPIIEYKGSGILKFLADITAQKDSPNPDYRKAVPLDMRKFVERFVKDLYVSETKGSVPRKYQNVPWGRLSPLLKQCKSFQPSDEAVLKNTHDFTTQFLHDDQSVGQTVPSSSQLKPHYDALESIKEKYKKVLGLQ